MSRQIVIEISDDGKEIKLLKDESVSIFERTAILNAVISTPNMEVEMPRPERPLPEEREVRSVGPRDKTYARK